MESPIVKEEKIDIKQGLLDFPSSDRLLPTFKKWKQRYFVFCQIRKGKNNWLKLYYHKSHSSHKEGNMPIDFIDITHASDIGIMDKDMDGHSHIIYINTPGKKYHLSASSCEERSQWLLALRAYKYNDESKLPPLPSLDRATTWTGKADHQYHQGKRKISEPASGSYRSTIGSRHKLKEMYLVCPKCKDRYISKEIYEWVRPENSDLYKAIHNSMNDSDIDEGPYYSEIRDLELTPLVSVATKSSSVRTEYRAQNNIVWNANELFTQETSVDEEEHSEQTFQPALNIGEEYVRMSGGNSEYGNEGRHSTFPSGAAKTQAAALTLGARDSPLLSSSPERPLLISATPPADHAEAFSHDKEFLRHSTPAKTIPSYLNISSERYTSEPSATGPKTSQNDSKNDRDVITDETSSCTPPSDNTGARGLGERKLLPAEVSKLLKNKYRIESPVFIADV